MVAAVSNMARLVRRDVVAVGKKEIQRMPLIGQAMGAAGVVFIDRSNRDKAIESMAPLMDAMRNEGKSLVIAPEGTRAPTRKLAPFKKGGFHMAMQVGVPIVPVVIHNAGDIAPKGDFLFQPGTVRVEVLPPVDTSQWTATKMNEQVTEVRNLFLRALGQPEQTVEEALKERNDLPEDMRPENAGRKKATKKPTRAKQKAAAKTGKKPTGKRRKTAPVASDKTVAKPGKRVPGKKSTAATKGAGSKTSQPKTPKGSSKKPQAGATAKKPPTTAKAKAAPRRALKAKAAPAVKPKLAAKS